MSLEIKQLINDCKENANYHGWKILWDIKKPPKFSCQKILSIGDALCLCHSELSEALEAHRDNNVEHFSEEIADEFIRLFYLCGDLNIDIEKHICEKMAKNKLRPINHGRINY